MAVTIAPSVEACQAIADRINAGTTYCLPVKAEVADVLVDRMETDSRVWLVDVIHEEEQQLEETLSAEDPTSHEIRVWVRSRVRQNDTEQTAALKLILRQIFQQLNTHSDASSRVKLWESEVDGSEIPNKAMLREQGIFSASLTLRVEVNAS